MPSDQYMRVWARWRLVNSKLNYFPTHPGYLEDEKALRRQLDKLEAAGEHKVERHDNGLTQVVADALVDDCKEAA